MTSWVASKFNADTDPSRPVVGTTIVVKGETYQIMEVGWCQTSDLLKEIMAGVSLENSKIMQKKNYDACLANEHPTRPGVQWLVWVNKQE